MAYVDGMSAQQIPTDITIERVDTPEQIVEHIYDVPFSEITGADGFSPDLGEDCKLSPEEFLDAIRFQGVWGCAHQKEKRIVFWASEDVKPEELVHFFAHELGHILYPHHRNQIYEEEKAERYGQVARFAYEKVKEILGIEDSND